MNRSHLGFDAAGSGPPVVLLHAFPLSREMWRPQIGGLSDVARVLAPDTPGFGDTPPAEWTVDSYADTLAEWLPLAGVTGSIVLGGLSMGGYV
ncbi:MAG: alpha/beta fold hydrolase, partial [Fimbriiglobus sp.]